MEGIDASDELVREISLSREEIVARIKACGLVGLGGATFPTHVKLMIPDGKKAEYLLINGVECEPYLTSDHRLMLEKAVEVVVGVRIMMLALDVNKAMIGIENNKPDAIEKLRTVCEQYPGISVQALKVKYPQGGEKQLIKAAVNREVPSGKLPIEVGCVVSNVGTAFAVYEAVQKTGHSLSGLSPLQVKLLQNRRIFSSESAHLFRPCLKLPVVFRMAAEK